MKHRAIISSGKKRAFMINVLFLLLLFTVCFPLYGAYYWDYPEYIAENTERVVYSDVKAINAFDSVMIFTISSKKGSYGIELFRTKDFVTVEGPLKVVERVEKAEGFFPHYDVLLYRGHLYLVWNTLTGDLKVVESSDRGLTWTNERTLDIKEAFSFDPRLYVINDELFLFYHTESEGRRIDFFYVESQDSGRSITPSVQIARGFAGSFFPYMASPGAKTSPGEKTSPEYSDASQSLYLVWQSRPLSEQETTIFDIYLSISKDGGKSWSAPLNLTEDVPGESTSPFMFFEEDRFALLWEGDHDGAWGVYYREYNLDGKPLGAPKKISHSLVNAVEARFLQEESKRFIFYLDERDGQNRLYVASEEDGEWIESGPISGRISHYEPVHAGDDLYIIVQDSEGLAYIGPDRKVQRLVAEKPLATRIGPGGTIVSWKEVEDSSGIEGYCYTFNQNEDDEPEIVNLASDIRSISITPVREGDYYLHLRAQDRAGNLSETLTIPFEADFTPPPLPSIVPLDYDPEGFYKNNSPFFQWKAEGDDIAGYNYVLSKKKLSLETSRIRTKSTKVSFDNLEGGTWYFNIASVDYAGNISPTVHEEIRLRQLPEKTVEKPEPVFLWTLSRRSFKVNPFLNISLYILLGGLLCITLFISLDVVLRYLYTSEEKAMEAEIRKKRLGLRFKFSILIGALVLLLTIGISTILSVVSVNQEKQALANQMYDKAVLSLENMTNVAREGILNNDELLLLSVISKTMENKDIKHSIILNNQNKVVAHSDINAIGETLEDSFSKEAQDSDSILIRPEFSAENLAPLYELASPVVFAGRRIGTVRIEYSTESIFQTIDELRRRSIYNTIIITLVTIVLGIVGATLLATITIKPIKILAKGVDIIGSGKLDHKIRVKARDEIGVLADEFNRMTERLLEYQQQMEMKAKLDEQLEIARGIQQDLIPSVGIDTDRISIDGFYKAASGVGGDYYDFIEIDKGKYGLIMSDVAGKGVPASLMMIMIRSVFKSLIHSGVSDPSRVTTLMNNTLVSDISSDRFATLFFAVFNMRNKTLRYTNAGYGPLMIYNAKQNRCSLVSPPEGSFPIGVMPDVDYLEEQPIKLGQGDAVFLFTDGIHEARNAEEREYGIERLIKLIPTFAEKGSKEMANLIVNDVLAFVGDTEQYDDMTLMVMKVK